MLSAKRIEILSEAKKLSQQGLAAKAGLHYTYVGPVERGESNISFDNIVRIADALEIPLKELFGILASDTKHQFISVCLIKSMQILK